MSFPILYEANEHDFTHLGLGVLKDTTSAFVTETRNGTFELEIQYPIDGFLFSELKIDRLIKVDASQNNKNQRFKIIRITTPAKELVTVYAEHVSYLTADLPLKPKVDYSGNAQTALNTWKNSIVDNHPLTVFSDIETVGSGSWTIDRVESARRALGGVQGSILDVYGGEYFFDNYNIALYANRGEDNGALIAYGKNITDLVQEENIANTFTSIYPFSRFINESGIEVTLTLPEYYIDSEYVENYANRKIQVVDFSEEDIRDVNTLRTRAQNYIATNEIGIPKINLKIKFINLEKTLDYKDLELLEEINLCDIVTIYFEKLNIYQTAKVTKVIWDVLLDRYDEIEIGERRATLTKTVNTEIKEQEEQTTILIDGLRKQILENYWNEDGYNYDLRAGNEYGLPGGYYSFNRPIDQNPTKAIYMGAGTLLIADAKNPDGSWRWQTMATGDGIVADAIHTGLLTDGTGATTLDLSNGVMKFDHTDGSYTQIGRDGLRRFDGGTTRPYQYRTYVGSGVMSGSMFENAGITVQLPDDFKGKNFSVIVSMRGINEKYSDGYQYFAERVYIGEPSRSSSNGTFNVRGWVRGKRAILKLFRVENSAGNMEYVWFYSYESSGFADAIMYANVEIMFTYVAIY